MKLAYTRQMVHAAITGELDEVDQEEEAFFGLHFPVHIEGVPDEVLRPRQTWEDPQAYDEQAQKLVEMFQENFAQFASEVDEAIIAAGPHKQ